MWSHGLFIYLLLGCFVSEAKQIQRAFKLSAALQTNKLKKRASLLTVAALFFIDIKRPWRVYWLSASTLAWFKMNQYQSVNVSSCCCCWSVWAGWKDGGRWTADMHQARQGGRPAPVLGAASSALGDLAGRRPGGIALASPGTNQKKNIEGGRGGVDIANGRAGAGGRASQTRAEGGGV